MSAYRLGIIGSGNMARAIVANAIRTQTLSPQQVAAYDPSAETLSRFCQDFGVRAAPDLQELARSCDIALLAVKPQDAKAALRAIAPAFESGEKTLISIAAGLSIAQLAAYFSHPIPIVRVMPNTPIQIGMGTGVLTCNRETEASVRQFAEQLFASGGHIHVVADESGFDAVTAVSGSGPAYLFLFMEALEAAATRLGLEPPLAKQLVEETIAGAAGLAKGKDLKTLRGAVTSKGGTTEAALAHFESNGFRQLVFEALEAAKLRSAELSKGLAEKSIQKESR